MTAEIGRFLSMVVMLFNICNQSDFTRKQCLTNWDEWLTLHYTKPGRYDQARVTPYQNERDALQSDHGSITTD